MVEFLIKISKEKTVKAILKQPLFNEYRYASMELEKIAGKLDKLACGSSLVQHCWQEGDEELKNGDTSKDPDIATAYASLCMDVYNNLYTAFSIDIKKK